MNVSLWRRLLLVIAGILTLLAAGPAMADVVTPSQARFDAAVEQARATMLTSPRDTIARAAAVSAAAQSLDGRSRIVGQATGDWLAGEAYLRINDTAHAGPLIERAWRAIANDPPTKLSGDILLSMGGLPYGDGQRRGRTQ